MKRAMPILNAGVAATLLLMACSDDEPTAPATPEPASLVIAPAQDTLNAIGDSLELGATVYDTNQEEMPDASITWSNLDPAIATVGESGRVVSVAVGSARIRAASGDLADTALVVVRQVADAVVVNPGADTLNAIGDALELSAAVYDASQEEIPDASVAWSSLDPDIATVDDTGEVVSAAVGSARIEAASGDVADTVVVLVRQVPNVVVDPGADTLSVGGTLQLAASVADSNDVEVAGASVDWWSANPVAASVDETGKVTAAGLGTTQVIATYQGVTDTAEVAVYDQVAFRSSRDGDNEIYIVNSDGTNPVNISMDGGADTDPVWSPDGSKIAFVTDRDGDEEIYVVNVDGTGVVNVSNDGGFDRDPTWSPDGSRLAFQSSRDGDWEIFVVDADGSDIQQLTHNDDQDSDPDWSPVDDRITFRSDSLANPEIAVIQADGTGLDFLTDDLNADYTPVWSPDGGQIAFRTNRDGNFEIYVMNADGTDETNLTNDAGNDSDAAWSPDGAMIAFRRDWDIHVMNADGSDETVLTTDGANNSRPTWSPDGTRIGFESQRSGNYEIYSITVDGRVTVRMTNDSNTDVRPAWRP